MPLGFRFFKAVVVKDWFNTNLVAMSGPITRAIRQKLGDAVTQAFPAMTRREVLSSPLEGKEQAVIGMRRAGKTTFLYQCLADRLAAGECGGVRLDRFSKVFAPIGLNFGVGESSSLRSKNGGKRPKARPSALFDQSWSPLHSFLTPWMASL